MPKLLFKLAFIFGLTLPATAFAATDTFVIYSYANAEVMEGIFKSIAMWMNSNEFTSLAKAIGLLGFLGITMAAFYGGDVKKISLYAATLIAASYLLLGVKVKVIVDEMVPTAASGSHMPIDNIPAIAALPMWGIGVVGKSISDSMNTVFSVVNNGMPNSSNGMPFGGSYGIMHDLTKQTINDPYVRKNLMQYLQECMLPFTANGIYNPREMLMAENFWQEIGANNYKPVNQYIPVFDFAGTESIKSCDEAYPIINNMMITAQIIPPNTGLTGWQSYFDALKSGGLRGSAHLAAANGGAAIMQVSNWATGTSEGAANLALNSAMSEIIRGTYSQAAVSLGADELVLAVNTENARRAQKSSWYTTSILFRDMSGYFYSILQVVLIGLVPLVVFLALMPGFGFKVVGGYFKVLFWLMLWQPGLTLIDFVMQSYYIAQVSDLGTVCGSGAIGCTASIGITNGVTENMMVAAGFVATLMPALLWGIVSTGSFAVTSMLERGSGAGFATQAAGSAASGSVRAGDISMANSSMNGHIQTYRSQQGTDSPTFSSATGSTLKQDAGGDAAMINGQQVSNKVELSRGDIAERSAAIERSAKIGYDKTSSATWSSMNEEAKSHAAEHSKMVAGARVWDSKESYEKARAMQEQQQKFAEDNKGKEFKDGSTKDWSSEAQVYASGKAAWDSSESLLGAAVEKVTGGSVKLEAGGKVSTGLGFTMTGSDTNSRSIKIGDSDTSGKSNSSTVKGSGSDGITGSETGSSGAKTTDGFSSKTQNSIQETTSRKEALETAQKVSQRASSSSNIGYSASFDNGSTLDDVQKRNEVYNQWLHSIGQDENTKYTDGSHQKNFDEYLRNAEGDRANGTNLVIKDEKQNNTIVGLNDGKPINPEADYKQHLANTHQKLNDAKNKVDGAGDDVEANSKALVEVGKEARVNTQAAIVATEATVNTPLVAPTGVVNTSMIREEPSKGGLFTQGALINFTDGDPSGGKPNGPLRSNIPELLKGNFTGEAIMGAKNTPSTGNTQPATDAPSVIASTGNTQPATDAPSVSTGNTPSTGNTQPATDAPSVIAPKKPSN